MSSVQGPPSPPLGTPGTKWDKDKDPVVANGAPGFRITYHGFIIDAQGVYVSGSQPGTVPTLPGDKPLPTRGDGGNPPATPAAPVHTGSMAAWAGMTNTAFRTLPGNLYRARLAARRARWTV